MYDIKACDFVKYGDAKLLIGNKDTILQNFKKDTREIENGDTYLGIQGEKFNRKLLF